MKNVGHTQPFRATPRTDPYVRNYRIRLLPWMLTREPLHVHQTTHATWLRTVFRPNSGTVSGPVAIARCSPRSVPFPPPAPRVAARHPCSPVSPVLWDCLTPRRRTRRTYGIAPSPTDPIPWENRISPGPHGFREKGFQPCRWS